MSSPLPPATKQSGASSVEFLLMATVICTLLVVGYDATRAWMLRQVLLLALQESNRAAITLNLQPKAMQQQFDRTAAAWWGSEQGQQHYYQRFSSRYGFDVWRLWQLSPSDQDFSEHEDKILTRRSSTGHKHINTQHQLVQHLNNKGRHTQQSIFGANTLHTQLIFWYEPSLAFSRALVRLLWPTDTNTYLQQGKAQGLVPIRLHASLPMQSHPIQWPLPEHSPIQRVSSTAIGSLAWYPELPRSFMTSERQNAPHTPEKGTGTETPPSTPSSPEPTIDEPTLTPSEPTESGDLLSEETACKGATCCY
ncbi:pilus assembly protein [Alcaligenaceae bacterium 429]|nr:pilus assembly protein [Alcaligenaceae bacterium 429]